MRTISAEPLWGQGRNTNGTQARQTKADHMQQTSIAPRLILPDGRIRLILDRLDPLAEYPAEVRPTAMPAQSVAIATARPLLWSIEPDRWLQSAQVLIGRQRQQMTAFSIGFTASIAVVVTALAAHPTSKRAEAATAKPVLIAESRAENQGNNRLGTFAAPSLTAQVRIAKFTVIDDEHAPMTPTPAFTQGVATVVATLTQPATTANNRPIEAPGVVPATTKTEAPVRRSPPPAPIATKAKAQAPAAPVKIAKTEAKPVEVRAVDVQSVDPSPRMAKAMASRLPPMPSAKSPLPTSGTDWSRSALGMNQNGP